ncbi:MAG: glycosyltransferase [Bacteroidetes bacterium]|nr:MAG: glycosyltransferase [Bacteroidota bacterium]
MHKTFLSVIGIVHQRSDYEQLAYYLRQVYGVLVTHFTDFEIILVNNVPEWQLDKPLAEVDAVIKKHIYLLQLANRTNKNNAILAGLDRANGDYAVIFEGLFQDKPELILELYAKTQEKYDLVYLQAQEREGSFPLRVLYRIFYFILKRYSQLRIDERAHNTRIISRRALNSVLRLRENLRYMKAVYSIVGYRTTALATDQALPTDESLNERFRTALVAITSYTTFLRSLMLWIFLISVLFLAGVTINALKVKFTQKDIFGNFAVADPGWTFLVILIAVFFAVTTLNLYIISIYLSNIYTEMKQRPPYIIESVQRF